MYPAADQPLDAEGCQVVGPLPGPHVRKLLDALDLHASLVNVRDEQLRAEAEAGGNLFAKQWHSDLHRPVSEDT